MSGVMPQCTLVDGGWWRSSALIIVSGKAYLSASAASGRLKDMVSKKMGKRPQVEAVVGRPEDSHGKELILVEREPFTHSTNATVCQFTFLLA